MVGIGLYIFLVLEPPAIHLQPVPETRHKSAAQEATPIKVNACHQLFQLLVVEIGIQPGPKALIPGFMLML